MHHLGQQIEPAAVRETSRATGTTNKRAHGWHQCARCATAWRGAKAVLGRASGLGELTLITQRAGVALVQDVVCR